MASSYSPLLRLEIMTQGEKTGQWGTITNTNLENILEQAVAGTSEISITGSGGSITLTTANGASDQAREAILRFTGTYGGGTVNVIAPASSKIYLVINSSNQSVRIKTSLSTGVTVDAGQVNFVAFNTGTLDFQLASASLTNLGAFTETVSVGGNVSGAVSVNLSLANVFTYTLTGNTVFSFSNPPASSSVSKSFTLIIRQDAVGSRTATFTGAKYTDSIAPTLTTTPNRYDVFTFFTIDAGSSYFATYALANVT